MSEEDPLDGLMTEEEYHELADIADRVFKYMVEVTPEGC